MTPTICAYVTTIGFKSIETSPNSDTDGKHYCIIPWTQWDKIQCALEKTLNDKLSYIGTGNFAEQFKANFSVYLSVRNVQCLTGTVHQIYDRIKDCIMMTDAQQDLKDPATNAGNDTTPGSSLKNSKRKYSAEHKLDITGVTCNFTKLTVSTVPPKGNITWGKTTEQNNDKGIDIVSKGYDDSTRKSVKTMVNQTTAT